MKKEGSKMYRLLFLSIFISLLLFSCGNITNYKYSRTITKQYIMQDGILSVSNRSGNIDICRQTDLSSDKIDIKAVIKAYLYEADLRKTDLNIDMNLTDKTINIEPRFFELYSNDMTSIDINLIIPVELEIDEISNISGNISTDKINKISEINNKSGNITISGSNLISEIKTTSGNIKISDCKEIGKVYTTSGNIDIECKTLNFVQVESGNINVILSDQSTDMQLKTVSGNITLSLTPNKNVKLEISADTTSGKIVNNIGNTIGNTTVNGSITRRVILSTISGNITINK